MINLRVIFYQCLLVETVSKRKKSFFKMWTDKRSYKCCNFQFRNSLNTFRFTSLLFSPHLRKFLSHKCCNKKYLGSPLEPYLSVSLPQTNRGGREITGHYMATRVTTLLPSLDSYWTLYGFPFLCFQNDCKAYPFLGIQYFSNMHWFAKKWSKS